jgi:hypothetical protein
VPVLPDWAIQVLQVVVILALAPLTTGMIARAEAIIRQRHAPRLLRVCGSDPRAWRRGGL